MHTGKSAEDHNQLVHSYLFLRQAIGWVGLALPFILALNAALFLRSGLEPSISEFFFTPLREVFVASLCCVGVFLLFYRGYPPRKGEWVSDQATSNIAGCAAIGVALIPTYGCDALPCTLSQHIIGRESITAGLHFGLAAVFFGCLAVFCFVLFTRHSGTAPPDPKKLRRNMIYRCCGTIIVLSILALAIHAFLLPERAHAALQRQNFVFYMEAIGVAAFGISWLVKGQAMQSILTPLYERP